MKVFKVRLDPFIKDSCKTLWRPFCDASPTTRLGIGPMPLSSNNRTIAVCPSLAANGNTRVFSSSLLFCSISRTDSSWPFVAALDKAD